MLAGANPKILGYLRDRTQHLVPPRLAARALLRYWRLRSRFAGVVLAGRKRVAGWPAASSPWFAAGALAASKRFAAAVLAAIVTAGVLAAARTRLHGNKRVSTLISTVAGWLVPSPVSFLSHVLVLSLGFVLVVPILGPRASLVTPVAARSGAPHYITALYSSTSADSAEADRPPVPHPPARVAPTAAPRVAVVAAAPTARPKPAFVPPPPGSGGDGLAAIYSVFNGSPGLTWALRVANCESHYNPLAVNRYSGASGLFQFMPSTWNANFPGQNIWDPYAQARGALAFYNAGRTNAWTCK